jgi:hypothetical protein
MIKAFFALIGLVVFCSPSVRAEAAGPSEVHSGIYIQDIQHLDIKSHSYMVDLYLWFRWKDKQWDPSANFEFMNSFELWGTKDGRQGSYTPPTVLTRTSPGPAVYTNTTALAPGKQECEGPFIGATTTFNYNIIQPDGTTKTQEFFSSYRPLAKSCLVGVDPATMPTDPIATDSTTTETPATP